MGASVERARGAGAAAAARLPLPFFSVRGFAVPEALRPWVECIFVNEETSQSAHYSFFRVPELSAHLGFVTGAFDASGHLPTSAKIVLGGARRKVHAVPFPAPEVIVFQLRPGTLKALQIPSESLRDLLVDFRDVVPAWASEALDRVAEEPVVRLRVRALCDWLERRLQGAADVRLANALLRVCTHDRSTRDWANAAGYSERQLRRIFLDVFALSPKELARVQRIRAVFRSAAASWADAALECGYYDQSHLIHEFRATVGDTPQRFAQKLAEPRLIDGTTAILPRESGALDPANRVGP